MESHHFLIIWLPVTIVYSFEVIYVYYTCMVEKL